MISSFLATASMEPSSFFVIALMVYFPGKRIRKFVPFQFSDCCWTFWDQINSRIIDSPMFSWGIVVTIIGRDVLVVDKENDNHGTSCFQL